MELSDYCKNCPKCRLETGNAGECPVFDDWIRNTIDAAIQEICPQPLQPTLPQPMDNMDP